MIDLMAPFRKKNRLHNEASLGFAPVKLHSSGDAGIRVTLNYYSHETHDKTRNIIVIFV